MKWKQIRSLSWQKLKNYTVTQEKLSIELQQRLWLDINLSIVTAKLNSWVLSYWENPVFYWFSSDKFYVSWCIKTVDSTRPIFVVDPKYRPESKNVVELAWWWFFTLDTNWDVFVDTQDEYVNLLLIPFYF